MLTEPADLAARIPIEEASAVEIEYPGSVGAGSACARTKEADHGSTILLVEDDPQVRELVRDILRRGGFHVLAADSECQALWHWTRHWRQIDLLVTDMMIPHCSTGVDLAKKLQNNKAALRVIYISGFGSEIGDDDRAFFRRSLFLQKPIDAATLLEAVSKSLTVGAKKRSSH